MTSDFQDTEENHGSTPPRSSFSISYKAGLVTVSSFHLSEKHFIFPSFLKDIFSQKWYFYLTIIFLSMSFYHPLAYKVCDEEYTGNFIRLP